MTNVFDSLTATKACPPTMPVPVGFMPHPTHPLELVGVATNAMESEELEAS